MKIGLISTTARKKPKFKDIERRRAWARFLAEKARKIALTGDNIQRIKYLYYDMLLTQRELAEKFGVSQTTISYVMNKVGIKARPQPRFEIGHLLTEKQREALSRRKPFEKGFTPWNKGIVNKEECDNCGKNFHRSHSRISNLNFCSRSCYLVYQKLHGKELATIPKPNQGELELLGLLRKVSENWKYVGDGQFWVEGKNPDFWDGGLHLIELFGGTWHSDGEAQERMAHFQKHNYYCMVIWYSQLRKPEKLETEIRKWSGEKCVSVS